MSVPTLGCEATEASHVSGGCGIGGAATDGRKGRRREASRAERSLPMRGLLLLSFIAAASGQRAIHWVIRVSDLETTLNFTSNVLGMKVLRHEENDKACELTCNGDFNNAWSKTMVGYGPEDKHYALELTYNYGVDSYEHGNGLDRFVVRLPEGKNPKAMIADAKGLGYSVNGAIVTGPDGYRFELLKSSWIGHIESIVLRAAHPNILASWYAEMVGMKLLDNDGDVHTIGFAGQSPGVDAVTFRIETGAKHPEPGFGGGVKWSHRITPWEGRNALALPASKIRIINAQIKATAPHQIIHELRELKEKLGTLLILILRDAGGFELCLVSEETFDPSVKAATDFKGPDWNFRSDSLAAITGGASARDEL